MKAREHGRIGVVIPTLGEEERIGPCLAAVRAVPGIGEIVVVDGGSGDRTVAIASAVRLYDRLITTSRRPYG